MNKIYILLSLILSILVSSCDEDKFLQHDPTDKLSSNTAYKSENSIDAVLRGTYHLLFEPGVNTCSLYQMGIPLVNELRAEDLSSAQSPWWSIFKNTYLYNTDMSDDLAWYIWAQSYKVIDACNGLIENKLDAISDKIKRDDYIAQAKAIRGMVYLDLVGIFCKPYHLDKGESAGVPLKLIADHEECLPRGKVVEVYTQIKKDLTEALKELSDESSTKRINKNFIHGLLARYYLNKHEYKNAYDESSIVVGSVPLMTADELKRGLSGEPREAIFTFVNTKTHYSTYRTFTTYWDDADGMGKDIRIPIETANLFADNDIRKSFFWNYRNWSKWPGWFQTAFTSSQYDINKDAFVNECYMYGKFPRQDFQCDDLDAFLQTGDNSLVTEVGTLGLGNYTFMRASEMVLIKAECAARISGKNGEAQDELYKIQSRAMSNATKSTNVGETLINEILLEKRKELLGEGHRMRDVLRLGLTINRPASAWSIIKTIDMNNHQILFPIPDSEIKGNKCITNKDQNPGFGQ